MLLYKMVAPIPIVLRVTPKDGSFKAKTFARFKDASKFTGLSISGLREAYHKKRTKMTRSDGFEFELQWLQDISTDLPTRKSGRCKWELPNGEVCGVPLSFKDKTHPFEMKYLGRFGETFDNMGFDSIKEASKWFGVSENALRNACENNNPSVTRRSDKRKYWIDWNDLCFERCYIRRGVKSPVRYFNRMVEKSGGIEELKKNFYAGMKDDLREMREKVRRYQRIHPPKDLDN